MRDLKLWHVGGEDVHLRIPLLLKLRAKGFDVGAVGSADCRQFRDHEIPYWMYSLSRQGNPIADRRSYCQLRELFARHRPDIIHAFDTKPGILAPLAARRAGVSGRIRTITGMGYVFSSNSPAALSLRPVYRNLQRWASSASAVTVFQNNEDQEYFRRSRMVTPGRDKLIASSGIDVEQWTGNRGTGDHQAALRRELQVDRQLVVTMVSRVIRQKGVREFLQAARCVRARGIDARFVLVGPVASEGRSAVPLQIIDSFRDDVRYLGARSDVPELLSISDVFVLPSYLREGTPRVLLEAGAMGLPLITTNMPGCKDVVQHGLNGLLVPCRDVEALTEALIKLLQSEAMRKQMGAASRQHVTRSFNLAGVAGAYEEIYRSVLR